MEPPRRRMAQTVRPGSRRQEAAFGRPNAQLAVNRRGDALVVWGAKGRVVPRVAQLWARYRPAGRGWTKPVKLTRADSPPGSFTVALGDRGHAAIAWTTRNDRQIQILRTFPTPRP